jgi:hypothetical protein
MIVTTQLAAVVLLVLAGPSAPAGADREPYQGFSRYTDPGQFAPMLAGLPDDAESIAGIAARQTIHHNLLVYYGIPASRWDDMPRAQPPSAANVLQALTTSGPRDLYGDRAPEERVVGACFLESHLLASMLRYRKIPVRIRAGYFKDIRDGDRTHILQFWERNLREKGVSAELLKKDPAEWKRQVDEYSAAKNAVNHYIEHWVAEYWDASAGAWRLLDANTTFLRAHSAIEVGVHLPDRHFQFAHEAWRKMRTDPAFKPERYAEEPQDGRSHIRSQLLWDFYTLLNHDGAGNNRASDADYRFVKGRSYQEISPEELRELDALASLLARQPSIAELAAFYQSSRTLRLRGAETDPYSFVFAR